VADDVGRLGGAERRERGRDGHGGRRGGRQGFRSEPRAGWED
jgi:hypothetical protein